VSAARENAGAADEDVARRRVIGQRGDEDVGLGGGGRRVGDDGQAIRGRSTALRRPGVENADPVPGSRDAIAHGPTHLAVSNPQDVQGRFLSQWRRHG